MIYLITFKGQNAINFLAHTAVLASAVADYNRAGRRSRNPRQILSWHTSPSGDELCIELYSRRALSPGREGNSLWLFSHTLVDGYGFGRYLNKQGKLLCSA